jgi:hypothetical protein
MSREFATDSEHGSLDEDAALGEPNLDVEFPQEIDAEQAVDAVSKIRDDDLMLGHREARCFDFRAHDVAVLFRSGGARDAEADAICPGLADRLGNARHHRGHRRGRVQD